MTLSGLTAHLGSVPGVDGFDLFEEFRNHHAHLYVHVFDAAFLYSAEATIGRAMVEQKPAGVVLYVYVQLNEQETAEKAARHLRAERATCMVLPPPDLA